MYASRFMLLKHTIHVYAMLALAGSVWRHMGRRLTVSDGGCFHARALSRAIGYSGGPWKQHCDNKRLVPFLTLSVFAGVWSRRGERRDLCVSSCTLQGADSRLTLCSIELSEWYWPVGPAMPFQMATGTCHQNSF